MNIYIFLNVISAIDVNLIKTSYFWAKKNLKNSFGKGVFQILGKIKMTRKQNQLFGRHFETVQHFIYLLIIYLFIYLFIYFYFFF